MPSFVLEITSSSTRREDLAKRGRYAAWGVAEYFLYDPWEEYLDPPLQGFALGDGVYHPIALEEMLHGAPWTAGRGCAAGRWGSTSRCGAASFGCGTPAPARRCRDRTRRPRLAGLPKIVRREGRQRGSPSKTAWHKRRPQGKGRPPPGKRPKPSWLLCAHCRGDRGIPDPLFGCEALSGRKPSLPSRASGLPRAIGPVEAGWMRSRPSP